MDVLLPELMDLLDTDSELSGYIGELRLRRLPDNPKEITDPEVTVIPDGGADARNTHGAAIDVQVEIKIFAQEEGARYRKQVIPAARRIDQLLLDTMKDFSDNSVARRWFSNTGWQDIDQPQSYLIHLQNQYETRYWSEQRINALNN